MKNKYTVLGMIIWIALFVFNGAIAQGTWTQRADFPGEWRNYAAGFSIGTKCYIGKGLNKEGYPLKDFWEWDQQTNVWTRKADFPGYSSVGVISFSIGTKGYIGTGFSINSTNYTNEFWEYDPLTDTWMQKASLPGAQGRANAVGFAIGTKGYIGTGMKNEFNADSGHQLYQDFWEWDQATDVWTQKADFEGPARAEAVGFSIGPKGYIGTGYNDDGTGKIYKDLWEWDQQTNVWTQKAELPGSIRKDAVGFSIGNKGYIGIGNLGQVTALEDFWEWDQATNEWTQKADFAGIGRYGPIGFSIGNKGYVGPRLDHKYIDGGEIVNYPLDFWEFDPSGVPEPYTDIIPNGSTVKKLSSGQFYFINGPVWYQDSVLLFSSGDPVNIYSYDPLLSQFRTFKTNTGSNGLTLDKDKNLLACESNVVMLDKTGKVIKTLAETFNQKPFNGPNDLISDDMGGVYFSDAIFFGSPVQDKEAVYYIDSTGIVKRVIDDLIKPNGLVLSPDGKKLYVVDTRNKYLYSWDVASDGSLSKKSTLAELQTNGGDVSGADGMAIDIHGNIYVAGDKGIQIFTPQGTAITTIVFPERPANCDFGGKDFKTLYVTASTNLYSIDLNYPGYAVSRKKGFPNAVNPLSDQPLVTIYPNPVQNVLHIGLDGKKGVLEVLDATGKSVLIKDFQGNNPSVDVSALKQGIYLMKLLTDNQLVTGMFVKQ